MHSDARPAFPSTRWSRIIGPNGGRDLEAMARAYAGPIRAWLAARLRLQAAEADDMAQEAFAWLLQKDLLHKADPTRGRFRGFLKTALARFAIERWRHANAQKRGGGAPPLDLDSVPEPLDPRGRSPDQVLDDAWRTELLQRARNALESELLQNGRALHWALFRDYYLAGDEPDHAALAASHGVSRNDVSNWLDHAKRRYRALLQQAVQDTVGNADELRDELRWLFGPAAPRGRQ